MEETRPQARGGDQTGPPCGVTTSLRPPRRFIERGTRTVTEREGKSSLVPGTLVTLDLPRLPRSVRTILEEAITRPPDYIRSHASRAQCLPVHLSVIVYGPVTRRLTSKIHAVVDTNGLPVRLALTAGEAHDNQLAGKLLSRLQSEQCRSPPWL
jgi:hypothetical protein